MLQRSERVAKIEATRTKIAPKEVWEVVEAAEVWLLVDGEDEEEGDAGEEGALPVTVVIFTFIPPSQWPEVPQAKYLVPGLFSFTTSLRLLLESSALLMSQFL